MRITLLDFCILTSFRKLNKQQIINISDLKVLNISHSTEHDILLKIDQIYSSQFLVLILKSFNFDIGFYLLLAVTAFLQTFNRSFSPFRLNGIALAYQDIVYSLWKQSTKEMAASLAASGSICFPIGVDLTTLKFCLSTLQYWLALIAVTRRSYLGYSNLTFNLEFEQP